ncbi:40S ribosomal protein S23, partial [Galemys pyrenaicus]
SGIIKKAYLGTTLKANPFGNTSYAKRIVLKRKCVRVQLIKNSRKKITVFMTSDGGLNFIVENDEVLVVAVGRKNHAGSLF